MTAKFRFLTPLAEVEPRAHEESVRRWVIALCAVVAAVGLLAYATRPAPASGWICHLNADHTATCVREEPRDR